MHAHIEVLVRGESKRHARRTLNNLLDPVSADYWLLGGRFRTTHDPSVSGGDLLEEIAGLAGFLITRDKRGRAAFGPFMQEHPTDLLRLDDPRARAFFEDGRCCAVWWQKRTRLATPFEQRHAWGDEFRSARPVDVTPPEVVTRLLASPKDWWLATVDLHW